MSLTKKHFIAVGNIFKDEFKTIKSFEDKENGKDREDLKVAREQTAGILSKIAVYFQSENPNFDSKRFIDYCTTLK